MNITSGTISIHELPYLHSTHTVQIHLSAVRVCSQQLAEIEWAQGHANAVAYFCKLSVTFTAVSSQLNTSVQ